MNEIERKVNETLYITFLAINPKLVEEIQNRIVQGQRPGQVEAFYKNRCASDSQLPDYAYQLARHLLLLTFTRPN